jgi:hypothetical protein
MVKDLKTFLQTYISLYVPKKTLFDLKILWFLRKIGGLVVKIKKEWKIWVW